MLLIERRISIVPINLSKKDSSLREEEQLRIQSAKKFFETPAENGINVSFEKQLQSDDIIAMIKGVLA